MSITYAQALLLLDETGMSPEAMARRLDLSGMTLRRWRENRPNAKLPRLYATAIIEFVYQLVNEGVLSQDSKSVRKILKQSDVVPAGAMIREMGFSLQSLQSSDGEPKVLAGLAQIAGKETRRMRVDKSTKQIRSFQKMSGEWFRRIATLLKVITSRKMSIVDKLVAYGALFYLINPFDLIPDSIPVFGLIDDYVILGFAAAYYMKRFAKAGSLNLCDDNLS